jgi:glutamate-1-semialdehyde 2,1-aminomutase
MNELSRETMERIRDREADRFVKLRPRSTELIEAARTHMPAGVPMAWMATLYEHPPIVVARGDGASFVDVDGNEYVDFNLADTSMFTGYGIDAMARKAGEQVASGPQFLLPTEDAFAVAAELASRFPLPSWQFTLSATQANTEAIRVARGATGRSEILMFDGKYHGHADELLGEVRNSVVVPDGRGLLPDATTHVRVTPYNDVEALERELRREDVACVIAEAAITNTGVILPEEGFHRELRRLTRQTGTLLVIDETHTLVSGPGGLTRHWALEPDLLVLGKSISGGIPLGAYGMTAALAATLDTPEARWGEGVATGGTLFGNALSMAAARVSLQEVLTDAAYESAAARGARLADGIEAACAEHGFDWRSHRLFNRSGYTHAPTLPSNAAEARATFDVDLYNVQRLYMANRGVWEAIDSAGPACGIQTTDAHVDGYLDVLTGFLGELA